MAFSLIFEYACFAITEEIRMRGEAMNDYMRALHQRFFQEPEYTELEERIESARQDVSLFFIEDFKSSCNFSLRDIPFTSLLYITIS